MGRFCLEGELGQEGCVISGLLRLVDISCLMCSHRLVTRLYPQTGRYWFTVYTMYTVQYINYIMYSVQYTVSILDTLQYTVCIMYNVQYTVCYTVHFTVYSVYTVSHCTVYSVL